MKREFLQNLELSKEQMDAIMAENGRDIEKAKAAFSGFEEMQQKLEALEQQAQETEQLRHQNRELQEKWNLSQQEHTAQLQQMKLQGILQTAISQQHGRNAKAILALLDMEALRNSENPQEDACRAVQKVKEENDYLFESNVPPAYAFGTGMASENLKAPATLAGALREKFERKM